MRKKRIVSIIVTIFVLIMFVTGFILFFMVRDGINPISYVFHRTQVEITASSQLYPADIQKNKPGNYYGYYNSYDKNDEYDLYIIPIKVVNNSDFILTNLKLNNEEQDQFIIDFYGNNYFLERECPFTVYPKSIGYVTGLISVKKGTSQSEIEKIVNEIDNNVVLEMGFEANTEDGPVIVKKYTLNKEFDITNNSFDKNQIVTHFEKMFF